MTTRHEFLRSLHELLQPATYLEIGVQFGRSLAQVRPGTLAVGVDPNPMVNVALQVNPTVFTMASDDFFAGPGQPGAGSIADVDLAFIDGMHLAEYAVRDFIGVERLARADGGTVAVFDDVLPYRADIAGRVPLPGDWTGDVWKVDEILRAVRLDLTRILVDVDPTGVLVVLGLDPTSTALHSPMYDQIEAVYAVERDTPARYVDRSTAVQPGDALTLIREYQESHS